MLIKDIYIIFYTTLEEAIARFGGVSVMTLSPLSLKPANLNATAVADILGASSTVKDILVKLGNNATSTALLTTIKDGAAQTAADSNLATVINGLREANAMVFTSTDAATVVFARKDAFFSADGSCDMAALNSAVKSAISAMPMTAEASTRSRSEREGQISHVGASDIEANIATLKNSTTAIEANSSATTKSETTKQINALVDVPTTDLSAQTNALKVSELSSNADGSIQSESVALKMPIVKNDGISDVVAAPFAMRSIEVLLDALTNVIMLSSASGDKLVTALTNNSSEVETEASASKSSNINASAASDTIALVETTRLSLLDLVGISATETINSALREVLASLETGGGQANTLPNIIKLSNANIGAVGNTSIEVDSSKVSNAATDGSSMMQAANSALRLIESIAEMLSSMDTKVNASKFASTELNSSSTDFDATAKTEINSNSTMDAASSSISMGSGNRSAETITSASTATTAINNIIRNLLAELGTSAGQVLTSSDASKEATSSALTNSTTEAGVSSAKSATMEHNGSSTVGAQGDARKHALTVVGSDNNVELVVIGTKDGHASLGSGFDSIVSATTALLSIADILANANGLAELTAQTTKIALSNTVGQSAVDNIAAAVKVINAIASNSTALQALVIGSKAAGVGASAVANVGNEQIASKLGDGSLTGVSTANIMPSNAKAAAAIVVLSSLLAAAVAKVVFGSIQANSNANWSGSVISSKLANVENSVTSSAQTAAQSLSIAEHDGYSQSNVSSTSDVTRATFLDLSALGVLDDDSAAEKCGLTSVQSNGAIESKALSTRLAEVKMLGSSSLSGLVKKIDGKIDYQIFAFSTIETEPETITVLFQDAAGTTPVTADGDFIGSIKDPRNGNIVAFQNVSAQRPRWRPNAGGLRFLTGTIAINNNPFPAGNYDNLKIKTTGGFQGTMIEATSIGAYAIKSNITASEWSEYGRALDPAIAASATRLSHGTRALEFHRNREPNDPDVQSRLTELALRGNLPINSISSGVTNLRSFWIHRNDIVVFPTISLGNVTNLYAAWYANTSLTTFPQLDTSKVTDFSFAWRSCSSLTSFPTIDMSRASRRILAIRTNFTASAINAERTVFQVDLLQGGTTFNEAMRITDVLSTITVRVNSQIVTNWTLDYPNEAIYSFTDPIPDGQSVTVTFSQLSYFDELGVLTEIWRDCTSLVTMSAPILTYTEGGVKRGSAGLGSTWRGCTALQTFPSMDTERIVAFPFTWLGCTGLINFPMIDTSNTAYFLTSWQGCTGLTSFPQLNASKVTLLGTDAAGGAWQGCTGLTEFPQIDMPRVIFANSAWRLCTGLTSFPLINMERCREFTNTWNGCTGLTDFPLINTTSGTSFNGTWANCNRIGINDPTYTFPSIVTKNGTNFTNAWLECRSVKYWPTPNPSIGVFDFSNANNLNSAWLNCTSTLAFPLIDTSKVTNFSSTWRNCTLLSSSFPAINAQSGTNFNATWMGCSSLTDFPLIDTSKGTNFTNTWQTCTRLGSGSANWTFPAINTASGTTFAGTWNGCAHIKAFPTPIASGVFDFSRASGSTCFQDTWRDCSRMTSFPGMFIDHTVVTGTQGFLRTWLNCSMLTSFPLIETRKSVTFEGAWQNCTLLATFSAGMFDNCGATNYTNAFNGTALNQTSVDNILVSIYTASVNFNLRTGTLDMATGTMAAPGTQGLAAKTALQTTYGWTVRTK